MISTDEMVKNEDRRHDCLTNSAILSRNSDTNTKPKTRWPSRWLLVWLGLACLVMGKMGWLVGTLRSQRPVLVVNTPHDVVWSRMLKRMAVSIRRFGSVSDRGFLPRDATCGEMLEFWSLDDGSKLGEIETESRWAAINSWEKMSVSSDGDYLAHPNFWGGRA